MDCPGCRHEAVPGQPVTNALRVVAAGGEVSDLRDLAETAAWELDQAIAANEALVLALMRATGQPEGSVRLTHPALRTLWS